jgi:hypothetical protein
VCTIETGQVCKSGEQLQLTAATTICIPGLGLNFLLVMVGLSDQSWLSLCISHGWLLVCFWNHSLSRLRCSGVASAYGWVTILLYCLWLNEHIHYFLTPQYHNFQFLGIFYINYASVHKNFIISYLVVLICLLQNTLLYFFH